MVPDAERMAHYLHFCSVHDIGQMGWPLVNEKSETILPQKCNSLL